MQKPKKRRRQVGPVIIAVLFLLAACGISIDFFARQILETAEVLVPSTPMNAAEHVQAEAEPDSRRIDSPDSKFTASQIPSSESLRGYQNHKARPVGRLPSSEDATDGVGIVRDRESGVPELSLDQKEEDYKISLSPNKWNKTSQLLPNPMFVSQLRGRGAVEIRGGGWVAVDIAKSQIVPVELFRGKSGARPVIEARRLDGREIVTASNTGFPIVRGVSDLRVGNFEVFENPPCMVRFSGVTEDEVCEITLRNQRIRYRFEAPVLGTDAFRPDNVQSNVSIDVGRGNWVMVGSFNNNFHPIGDANRDGYPDFYAESVTGNDESGTQTLLISHLRDDSIEYISYEASFRSAR